MKDPDHELLLELAADIHKLAWILNNGLTKLARLEDDFRAANEILNMAQLVKVVDVRVKRAAYKHFQVTLDPEHPEVET